MLNNSDIMSYSWDFFASRFTPTNKHVKDALKRFKMAGKIKNKSPTIIDYQGFAFIFFLLMWCHQESNRGHKDFQSFALCGFQRLRLRKQPTELLHLISLLLFELPFFKLLVYFWVYTSC